MVASGVVKYVHTLILDGGIENKAGEAEAARDRLLEWRGALNQRILTLLLCLEQHMIRKHMSKGLLDVKVGYIGGNVEVSLSFFLCPRNSRSTRTNPPAVEPQLSTSMLWIDTTRRSVQSRLRSLPSLLRRIYRILLPYARPNSSEPTRARSRYSVQIWYLYAQRRARTNGEEGHAGSSGGTLQGQEDCYHYREGGQVVGC